MGGKENKVRSPRRSKTVFEICGTVAVSFLAAIGLHVFVYSFDFAPSGFDGIAAMLYEVTGINAGYFSLALNFPLLLAAWFILKRRYVLYTLLAVLLTSLFVILFQYINFYRYEQEGGSILAAVFSGLLLGVRAGYMLKINGSTGGADIIACIVREKSSYPYVERIIGIICYITIAFSYFVYRELDSVLLSVMQTFVYERTIAFVLRSNRNAVECRIITKTPEIIAEDLLRTLKHGATIVESRGVYTGEENAIVFTVINTRQIGEFIGIMKKYPEAFVCYGEVSGVNGNFRRNKNDPLR